MGVHGGRRWLSVGAVLSVLLVAACGSSGDDEAEDDDGGSVAVEVDEAANAAAAEQIVTASDALVEQWGDEGAFFVVMTALDEGYSITQIVEAAPAGDVGADGTIAGVEPAGEPLGLLGEEVAPGATANNVRRIGAGASGGDDGNGSSDGGSPRDRTIEFVDSTLGEMFTAAEGVLDRYHEEARRIEEEELARVPQILWEANVAGMTTALSARGYSPVQIVEAIFADEVAKEEVPFALPPGVIPASPCLQIVVDGQVVEPELPPALGIDCPPLAVSEDGDGGDDGGGDAAVGSDEVGGDYRFDGSNVVEDDGARLAVRWSGSFEVDDSTITGTGTGTVESEGTCSIGNEEGSYYGFSARWEFELSGSSDGENFSIVMTPVGGTGSVEEEPGTASGEACVELARDLVAPYAEPPEAGETPIEIVVPTGGGEVQYGQEPYVTTFEVTPAD